MKAVTLHLEDMKPLSDRVSVSVIELAAQSESNKDSQITVAIDEKHSIGEIVFLGQSIQECSGWIGASTSEYSDIKNEL